MPSSTLDDFLALNEQLVALVEAGVPVEIGLPTNPGSFNSEIQQINTVVARRISQGNSLDVALQEQPPAAPALYRQLLRVAEWSGDLSSALRAAIRLAEVRVESRQVASYSMIYPAVVCCFAYAGLIAFCWWLVPTMRDTYREMGLRPQWGLKILVALQETLPLWIALPPLGVALIVGLRRSTSHRQSTSASTGWPAYSKVERETRAANFADALAALLDSGMSFDDARAIVGSTNSMAHHTSSSAAEATPLPMPPLLHWAMWQSDSAIDRASALRAVAGVYRASARRRMARWRAIAPIILCLLVGGAATLLYGLALFLPIIQMLQGLSGIPQQPPTAY